MKWKKTHFDTYTGHVRDAYQFTRPKIPEYSDCRLQYLKALHYLPLKIWKLGFFKLSWLM